MLISKQFELTSLCVCVLKNGAYCLFSLGLIPLAFTSRLKGEINGNAFGSMKLKEFSNSTSGCPLCWDLFKWTRLGWAGELGLPGESQAGFCFHNEMAKPQFYHCKVFRSAQMFFFSAVGKLALCLRMWADLKGRTAGIEICGPFPPSSGFVLNYNRLQGHHSSKMLGSHPASFQRLYFQPERWNIWENKSTYFMH